MAFVREDKEAARTEAFFQRQSGRYARTMRVNVGENKGKWGVYVSRVKKGE